MHGFLMPSVTLKDISLLLEKKRLDSILTNHGKEAHFSPHCSKSYDCWFMVCGTVESSRNSLFSLLHHHKLNCKPFKTESPKFGK